MRKLKNPRIIKTFRNGHKLTFSRGKIDDYMVSVIRDGHLPMAPTDEWLFSKLAESEDRERVMNAILTIAGQINSHMSNLNDVTIPYDTLDEEKLLSMIAAMMLAEEKKENTWLGKMIKVLGCWQILMEGFTPYQAANWSKERYPSEIRKRIDNYQKNICKWPTNI